ATPILAHPITTCQDHYNDHFTATPATPEAMIGMGAAHPGAATETRTAHSMVRARNWHNEDEWVGRLSEHRGRTGPAAIS
ncbi:MAG: hypothetical protein ACP5VE_09830, partial [Chthonomonadales bacterium]